MKLERINHDEIDAKSDLVIINNWYERIVQPSFLIDHFGTISQTGDA